MANSGSKSANNFDTQFYVCVLIFKFYSLIEPSSCVSLYFETTSPVIMEYSIHCHHDRTCYKPMIFVIQRLLECQCPIVLM